MRVVGQLHLRPCRRGRRPVFESGPSFDCTHSRFAASPSPLPVLASAATRQASEADRDDDQGAARRARGPAGRCLGGVVHSATVLESVTDSPRCDTSTGLRGTFSPVAGKVTRLSMAEREPRTVDVHGRSDQLHRSRLRAGAAADPRHGGHLRQLGVGDRAAGDQPHRDRPRLPRPRRLGAGRRRLLARQPGQRPARPDAGARPRARRRWSATRSAAASRCSSPTSSRRWSSGWCWSPAAASVPT